MACLLNVETIIPEGRSIRPINRMPWEALGETDAHFEEMYGAWTPVDTVRAAFALEGSDGAVLEALCDVSTMKSSSFSTQKMASCRNSRAIRIAVPCRAPGRGMRSTESSH